MTASTSATAAPPVITDNWNVLVNTPACTVYSLELAHHAFTRTLRGYALARIPETKNPDRPSKGQGKLQKLNFLAAISAATGIEAEDKCSRCIRYQRLRQLNEKIWYAYCSIAAQIYPRALVSFGRRNGRRPSLRRTPARALQSCYGGDVTANEVYTTALYQTAHTATEMLFEHGARFCRDWREVHGLAEGWEMTRSGPCEIGMM